MNHRLIVIVQVTTINRTESEKSMMTAYVGHDNLRSPYQDGADGRRG
jgi:hypothetical protein